MADDDINRSDVLESMGTPRRTSRRTILRGAAAGVLAGLGFAGTASALTDPDRSAGSVHAARTAFASDRAARAALEQWGGGVLATLSAEGLIDRPELAALDIEDVQVAAFQTGGIATAHVMATATADTGTLRLAVQPHADDAYAILADGDDRTVYTETGEDDCVRGVDTCYEDWDGRCVLYSVMCCPDGDGYRCLWDEQVGDCDCPGVYDCAMSCPH